MIWTIPHLNWTKKTPGEFDSICLATEPSFVFCGDRVLHLKKKSEQFNHVFREVGVFGRTETKPSLDLDQDWSVINVDQCYLMLKELPGKIDSVQGGINNHGPFVSVLGETHLHTLLYELPRSGPDSPSIFLLLFLFNPISKYYWSWFKFCISKDTYQRVSACLCRTFLPTGVYS